MRRIQILLLLMIASSFTLQGCSLLQLARGRDHHHRHPDEVIIHHGDNPDFVPSEYLPPHGYARVWHRNLEPDEQPPPYKVN